MYLLRNIWSEVQYLTVGDLPFQNPVYDSELETLQTEVNNLSESQARYFVEKLARMMQSCQLLKHAPDLVSNAFIQSRLGEQRGFNYGCLPDEIDCEQLINRAAEL